MMGENPGGGEDDCCAICCEPFKLDPKTGEKLVLYGIQCGLPISRNKIKTNYYSFKIVFSTIYNVGLLWNDPVDGVEEEKIGACPECAKALTNLYIFYHKVDQLLNEESRLYKMLKVLEQINGPRMNTLQKFVDQPQNKKILNNNNNIPSHQISSNNKLSVPPSTTVETVERLKEVVPHMTGQVGDKLKVVHTVSKQSGSLTTKQNSVNNKSSGPVRVIRDYGPRMNKLQKFVDQPQDNHQLSNNPPQPISSNNLSVPPSPTAERLEEVVTHMAGHVDDQLKDLQPQNKKKLNSNNNPPQPITSDKLFVPPSPTVERLVEVISGQEEDKLKDLPTVFSTSKQSGSLTIKQNSINNNSSSLVRVVRLDHDYLPPSRYKRVITYANKNAPLPLPQKENNQEPNQEPKSLTCASSSRPEEPQNSTSNQKDTALGNPSMKEVNDVNVIPAPSSDTDHNDVDMCTASSHDDDDVIIIETIVTPPPTSAAAVSISSSSETMNNSTAAAHNEDVELQMEFMTCGACQKKFMYEKNFTAHRKICRFYPPNTAPPPPVSPAMKVTTSRLKSSAKKQRQQRGLSKLKSSKKHPPSLNLPTIRKRLESLAPITSGKAIICGICQTKFGDAAECILHLTQSHFPFCCNQCDVVYSNQIRLNDHMTRVHGKTPAIDENLQSSTRTSKSTVITPKKRGQQSHRCAVCKKLFYTRHSLDSHNCPGPKTKPLFRCEKCSKCFKIKSRLNAHSRAHELKENKPLFQCEGCSKCFKVKSRLKRHSRTHEPKETRVRKKKNNDEPRVFKCPTCDKDMGNRTALSNHLWIHLPRCLQCRKRFKTEEQLKDHETQCPGIQRPHICTYGDPPCGRAFHRKVALTFHHRRHVGEMPFVCEICGKAFIANANLTIHVKIHHQGFRPFKCTLEGCNKAYSFKHNYEAHLNKHLGVKSHLCSSCGVGFGTKCSLDSHIQLKHSVNVPILCQSCPKRFATQSLMNAHFKRKHAEQPVTCLTCGKGFRNELSLDVHAKVHVSCPICGTSFSHHRARSAHMKKHEQGSINGGKTKRKRGRRKVEPEVEFEADQEEVQVYLIEAE